MLREQDLLIDPNGIRITLPHIRESTTTSDASLDKKTGLDNRELTTYIGGNTDKLFALFDLFRMQFSPCLRDIDNYTLYCNDPSIKYKRINSLLG